MKQSGLIYRSFLPFPATHALYQHDLTVCGLLGTRLENADIVSPQSWPVNQQRR